MTPTLHQRPWHQGLPIAVGLSTATVTALTVSMLLLRLHINHAVSHRDMVSLTHCAFSESGEHALITYRSATPWGNKGMHYRLAHIDLREGATRIESVAADNPWIVSRTPLATSALVVNNSGRAALHDLQTGNAAELTDLKSLCGCPDGCLWSADGRYLVTWNVNCISCVELDANAIRWELRGHQVRDVAAHPKAGLFAVLDGEIVEITLESGGILPTNIHPAEAPWHIAIDPAGSNLACLTIGGALETYRMRDRRLLWSQKGHGARTLPASHRPAHFSPLLVYSPDGRHLATAAHEGEWVVAVWNANKGRREATLRGHDGDLHGVEFLSNGSLASWSADGTLRVWDFKRSAVQRVISLANVDT